MHGEWLLMPGAKPGGAGGLEPPYPHATHGSPQHFSSMSEEDEEERMKKMKNGEGRKKKGK